MSAKSPAAKRNTAWLSYDPENLRGKKLFNRFGFEETGDMDGGEAIAALKL